MFAFTGRALFAKDIHKVMSLDIREQMVAGSYRPWADFDHQARAYFPSHQGPDR